MNSFSISVLILLVVIAIKTITTRLVPHDPLRFFRFYCTQLSNKVNKPQNSVKQRSIAGIVAVWLTLAPIVIVLWLFSAFIEVNWLWQGFLLYIALGAFGLTHVTKTVAQALVANQTYVAKQTLKPWVLRSTENLSPLGITKATIEMQLLRFLQQAFVVSCLFLFFGPLVALSYRLLLEMHYCWNTKQLQYYPFGAHIQLLVNIIQWLPVRLFSLMLWVSALGKNALLFWRLNSSYWLSLNNNIALSFFALILEVKLGGVAMYNKSKCRKVSFNNQAKQPDIADIIHASKKITVLSTILLFVLAVIATAIFIVQNE